MKRKNTRWRRLISPTRYYANASGGLSTLLAEVERHCIKATSDCILLSS